MRQLVLGVSATTGGGDERTMEKRRFTVGQANEALPALRKIVAAIHDGLSWLGSHKPQFQYLVREMNIPFDAPVSPEYFARLVDVRDALNQVDAMGCQLKDLQRGLVDFPSSIYGKDVLLCWRLGEDSVDFYHDTDSGYSGRRPIPDEARQSGDDSSEPSGKTHS